MRRWCYRWLPILFGCHCRPDRSFFVGGTQLPLCARCTGELAGILAGLATYGLVHPTPLLAALLLVPLVVDGGVQMLTAYESGNLRRLATGLLFGYGLAVLFLASTFWCLAFGQGLGEELLAGAV